MDVIWIGFANSDTYSFILMFLCSFYVFIF